MAQVHLCVDKIGKSKGFAFLQFIEPEHAINAFQNCDGKDFQGRVLHVLPADGKRSTEFAFANLPLKQQNFLRQRATEPAPFLWNHLYMSQDAVNASIALRKGISKSDLLDYTSSDAAVKQAMAEAEVIRDAKDYFARHGVDLATFHSSKPRIDGTAVLAKNFPHGTSAEELRAVFEPHGEVVRVLIPPTGTIAIVEFAHSSQAKVAYMKAGFKKFKDSILFLEKAPRDLFKDPPKEIQENQAPGVGMGTSVADLLASEVEEDDMVETATLFVKNLNFETRTPALKHAFENLEGFMAATVKTKPNPKDNESDLSMGFGFVQFKSKELAQQAIKNMDGQILDGHKLSIRASHRGQDAAEERRRQDDRNKKSLTQRKMIVKNLPFQTSKKDLRSLIEQYGSLKSLRLPKNLENRARGFAFAEFATPKEARHAFETLKDMHFLGRKLVVEWAETEPEDAEDVLKKMRQKAGSQLNKVTLQKLKESGGRQKFEIEGEDDAEDT